MSAFEDKQGFSRVIPAPSSPKLTALRLLSSPLLTALLVLAAIVQQAIGHLDCDVSWFITFAEKFVDGQTAYIDVKDPNPPLAFLSLAPAVLVARLLHVAVEPLVVALVFLCAAASIGLSFYVLKQGRTRSQEEWGALLNGAVYLLLVAPEIAFGEREHLALLLMAPMLTVLAVGLRSGRPGRAARAIAGVGAGLAVCFKPFFLLALLFPALSIAWRERSLRCFWRIEFFAAAAVALTYGFVVVEFFPDYRANVLALVADVYAPARDSWTNLLFHTLLPVQFVLLAAFAYAAVAVRGAPVLARVAAWASAGFLVSFLIQGKGWINHAYPGMALALFAWIAFILENRRHPVADSRLVKFLFVPLLVAAPLLHGGVNQWSNEQEHPGLREAILRVAPPHPRVIALARQLDYGHPVTRQIGGVWVGRQNALWTSSFVTQLLPRASDPAYRARLFSYRRNDLADFAQDVARSRPDVIIVESAGLREWALKQPETARVLDSYVLSGEAGEIEIWTRNAPG
jgi:hypothetical protein